LPFHKPRQAAASTSLPPATAAWSPTTKGPRTKPTPSSEAPKPPSNKASTKPSPGSAPSRALQTSRPQFRAVQSPWRPAATLRFRLCFSSPQSLSFQVSSFRLRIPPAPHRPLRALRVNPSAFSPSSFRLQTQASALVFPSPSPPTLAAATTKVRNSPADRRRTIDEDGYFPLFTRCWRCSLTVLVHPKNPSVRRWV